MSKTLSIACGLATAALLLALLPLVTGALSRTEARFQMSLQRQSPSDSSQQGSTGGTGGTSGGTSGEGGSSGSQSDMDNAAAQQLYDDLIQNGPVTDQLPQGTDLNTGEVQEAIEEVDTTAAGSGFLTILNSIITRFTNR